MVQEVSNVGRGDVVEAVPLLHYRRELRPGDVVQPFVGAGQAAEEARNPGSMQGVLQ